MITKCSIQDTKIKKIKNKRGGGKQLFSITHTESHICIWIWCRLKNKNAEVEEKKDIWFICKNVHNGIRKKGFERKMVQVKVNLNIFKKHQVKQFFYLHWLAP